jgi:maleylpyruvate isomerase
VREVLAELTRRTADVVEALAQTDLDAPSELPGWSRLTVACHLRYGAEAFTRLARDTLAGRPTAYYPGGRDEQRPATLVPRGDEDVVASLRDESAALDAAFASVGRWSAPIDEPEGIFLTLEHLPVFRLTEVEVHGTDLGVGLGPWSDTLIDIGLPMRLERLAGRTPQAPGAWIVGGIRLGDDSDPEVIDATGRDLFALTLGRIHLSDSFAAAFPGP